MIEAVTFPIPMESTLCLSQCMTVTVMEIVISFPSKTNVCNASRLLPQNKTPKSTVQYTKCRHAFPPPQELPQSSTCVCTCPILNVLFFTLQDRRPGRTRELSAPCGSQLLQQIHRPWMLAQSLRGSRECAVVVVQLRFLNLEVRRKSLPQTCCKCVSYQRTELQVVPGNRNKNK